LSSFVNITPVADFDHNHNHSLFFDSINHPIIAHSNAPMAAPFVSKQFGIARTGFDFKIFNGRKDFILCFLGQGYDALPLAGVICTE
jgi:hypothetical protein